MGRKDYLNDLATAQFLDVPNIASVKPGDDGELTFTYTSDSGTSGSITAVVSEVSDYPKSHDYTLFATDDAPAFVAAAIENAPSTYRKSIPQLLNTLSQHLKKATASGSRGDPFELDDDDGDAHMGNASDGADDSDALDFDDNDGINEDWGHDDYDGLTEIPSATPMAKTALEPTSNVAERVRTDLLTAKAAGFKIGSQGYLEAGNSCYLSLSCRIEKLGISEETMQAWSLEPHQYLILLFYFPGGYKDLVSLTSMDRTQVQRELEMRVGLSDHYKPPSLNDAQRFFKPNHKSHQQQSTSECRIKDTFISRPLDDLLNERLLTLVNMRLKDGMSWWGAERHYNELLGSHSADRAKRAKTIYTKDDPPNATYPQMVMEDELASVKSLKHVSFPLVAMQFLLRHFVRCTEFCLVCHTKIVTQLEAIKPYVCDNPLCLFQYMSLGFGPSLEHEIMVQPFVVDILVSFCYTSVASTRMREYPQGLGWMVSHPQAPILDRANEASATPGGYYPMPVGMEASSQTPSKVESMRSYPARLNRIEMQLLFDDKHKSLRRGDWIVIKFKNGEASWHCRVTEYLWPTVSLDKDGPILRKTGHPPQPPGQTHNEQDRKEDLPDRTSPGWIVVDLYIYEHNFDDLSQSEKRTSLMLLMDLLPSVKEMQQYLTSNVGSTIANWKERLPPAVVGILRWIIASNRSCIMQVDDQGLAYQNSSGADKVALTVKKGEQRIDGVDSWLQFRFAMGAPDKEKRFIESLHHGDDKFSSLFAWHGSPLSNWHSIIRQGLDFKETLHGRATGHGCYHSSEWATSQGYTRVGYNGLSGGWPSSTLKINGAIALNEIVNAPDKFVSRAPHYVVQHVDWIQTRYLFVLPTEGVTTGTSDNVSGLEVLQQDPSRVPRGPQGPLQIPASAIPRSRRPGQQHSSKKSSAALPRLTTAALNAIGMSKGTAASPIDLDTASVSTTLSDRALLTEPSARPPTPPPSISATPVTAYTPRTERNLAAMPSPTYATPKATMTIQKALLETRKVQESHIKRGTLHELGWYLDVQRMEESDNLYQWIVQMHSFPLDIPLGQQMKQAGIDAITFEIRFSANYPYSPPFLRVIGPRFLPFLSGGGGHVTAGGSVCMDLLTASGWSAVYSIESVLLQVRMALMSTDPRPAQLECAASSHKYRGDAGSKPGGQYGVGEAVQAFIRACNVHGWQVPKELREITKDDSF